MPRLRTALVPFAAAVCFLLAGSWLRFAAPPPMLPTFYASRFALYAALLVTCALWLLSGMPGWRAVRGDGARAASLLCLLLLGVWAFASQGWSFAAARPEFGLNAAMLWLSVGLFSVVVASAVPRRAVTTVVIAAALVNAVIVIAQVEAQGALGLRALGEFRFGAEIEGTSLLQAGGLTYVRPYGLFPHPNVLAGLLAVGVLLGGVLALTERGAARALSTAATVVIFVALLLTFSRGAWVGLAAGAAALLPYALPRWRRVLPLAALVVVTALVFFAAYRPLLSARAGAGTESLELRSVSDRIVITDFALRAIDERFWQGQGAGAFPLRSAIYLRETFFDLLGQNVHHVFLSAWAEMGLIGFVLLVGALVFGVEAALVRLRGDDDPLPRASVIGAVIALAVVGLFDHYPYSELPSAVLWWGLLAAAER